MKKPIAILSLMCLAWVALVWFAYQQPGIKINRCYAKLYMKRGGYRSWGWDYCYGFQTQNDGSEKHFYHKPVWKHTDMRKFSREGYSVMDKGKIIYEFKPWLEAHGTNVWIVESNNLSNVWNATETIELRGGSVYIPKQ